MGRKSNEAKVLEHEDEFEESEVLDSEFEDRTLILRREPLPRKAKLIASGVEEIRCLYCTRVKPIAGAEELGEGWICEDCLSDAEERKYGG
jgi:hypothetical protein